MEKRATLRLSKEYRLGNLDHPEFGGMIVAKALFDAFVKSWKEGKKLSVYTLLNEGFRGTAFIRLKKIEGQTVSDAEQVFYAWLDAVNSKIATEIEIAHKKEKDEYMGNLPCGQLFPAREVYFGTTVEEVADDSEI